MSARAVATAACLMLVVAACATDEASGPATAGLTATPTSESTTTTVPPPTTATPTTTSTTTSTTVAPSTTIEPRGPKTPTARAVAIFGGRAAGISQGWVPLGGWNGTTFVGAGSNTAPDWAQGADIRVSTLGAPVIGSKIGAKTAACRGISGPEIGVPVDAASPPTSGFGAIAIGGSWALRPRPIVTVDTEIPAYVSAARQLLGNRINRSATARVKQIVLTDFDGDDDETSIVVYESVETPARDGSGFSIVFAVDTNSAKAREIASSVVRPPTPTPTPTTGAGSGTSTTTTTVPRPVLERFRVLDVADLNGDRIMELVIHSWTADRTELDVYALDGAIFRRVAGNTCPR